MSSVQSNTHDWAEAYFDRSLIGEIAGYLADATNEVLGLRRKAEGVEAPPATRVTTGNAPKRAETPSRPGFFARLEANLWRQEQRRREAWLAESADIFELERRLRLLDRGRGN